MTDKKSIEQLRKEYTLAGLQRQDMAENPFEQFSIWYRQRLNIKSGEQNAMILATVSEQGFPSARAVLLKNYSDKGFVFFSNYNSRKAQDLRLNPNAALLFYWDELQRQLRIEGTVSKLDQEASDRYFQSRPRDSQISAWASHQSQRIENRAALEARVREVRKKFFGVKIPTPQFWGGLVLKANRFEFWQGRQNRLHDRFAYTLSDKDRWQLDRLAP